MTQPLDIANRALGLAGTRSSMSSSEFTNLSSNEAIQSTFWMNKLRDELNRMAPWSCTKKYAPMTYITSIPGSPENPGPAAPLWTPGLPAPPWAYEYQYPVDCLRARYIIPQYTATAGGVPIYPVTTTVGGAMIGWTGPALKFEIGTDAFYGVTAAAVSAGGTGYAIGDIITLVQPSFTVTQGGVAYTMPVGAPVKLQVLTLTGSSVATVSVINQVLGENVSETLFGPAGQALGGSYFSPAAGAIAQGSTTGAGTGATFTLTFGNGQSPQRIILCNQDQAILCYNQQVTDPNIMDDLFQDAWTHILASRLCLQLTGDKASANILIGQTNAMISEARKADGNEGITVNDVTPDFIRIRGNYGGPSWEYSPNMSFDWGSFYSPY